MRRSRNHIDYLVDDTGVKHSDPNDLERIIVQYFSHLFSSSAPLAMDEVLSSVCPRVTANMNEMLCRPYSKLEVETALFQMRPHKAPGPDGMNPYFFQKFWDIIGNEVSAAVLAILDGHPIPPKLNHTLVALIPKKPQPGFVQDYCPINLCNVIYKLVTKVISNRLKPLLPTIISDTQSAFTQGRLITDNMLIAFETFHAMKCDGRSNGDMAVKLDIAKHSIESSAPSSLLLCSG